MACGEYDILLDDCYRLIEKAIACGKKDIKLKV